MKLEPSVFEIDTAAVVSEIEAFIREAMKRIRRVGIVVPLSGGLDSSTTLGLCARAVGPERVTALMLPDRKGAPDALKYGRMAAAAFGVGTETIDTTRLMRAAGVYGFIANAIPSRRLLTSIVRRVVTASGRNLFIDGIRGTGDRLATHALASIYAKQRLRAVVTFRYADLRQLLVVGTAHKSEDMLGLFVKFGIDDIADVMPLKGLYRSHVHRIAEYIGVPRPVVERTPNPEMLPGIEDKYVDVFKVDAKTVDLVLYGFERGMTIAAIADDLGLAPAKVAELREAVELTQHMREPSMFPKIQI